MFNSLLYERERKRHERSFENFIKSANTFAASLFIYLFARRESFFEKEEEEAEEELSLVSVLLAGARERARF